MGVMRGWSWTPGEVLRFAYILDAIHYFDRPKDVIYYFEKPWKEEGIHNAWITAGKPTPDEKEAWQEFTAAVDALNG